jgi:hypothetical protein
VLFDQFVVVRADVGQDPTAFLGGTEAHPKHIAAWAALAIAVPEAMHFELGPARFMAKQHREFDVTRRDIGGTKLRPLKAELNDGVYAASREFLAFH